VQKRIRVGIIALLTTKQFLTKDQITAMLPDFPSADVEQEIDRMTEEFVLFVPRPGYYALAEFEENG
jgi:hypothetical protein